MSNRKGTKGPILFLIYINDFPEYLSHSKLRLLQTTASFTEISKHKLTALNSNKTKIQQHDRRQIGLWPSIQINAQKPKYNPA